MAASFTIVDPGSKQLRRRYVGVVVFFVLLILMTWGLRAIQVARVRAAVQERQTEKVQEALELIEDQFVALQAGMLAEAKAVAEAPQVVRGLQARSRSGTALGPEDLVAFFAARKVPARRAVELYDPVPRLVAWNGFSMPLDDALNTTRFLETYQTAVARDDDLRQALVVWWPVREGTRVLGAVRVMRLISFSVPVQNQYLRDFSLADTWQRAVRLPVQVTFGTPLEEAPPVQGQARLLQGVDGTLLGRVVVQPPSADNVILATQARFDDIMAFWTTMLLFWLTAGLWWWYRSEVPARRAAPRLRRLAVPFALLAVAWWGVRYALLAIEVPARWQRSRAPLAPLFDPAHLASTVGAGLMRATGELLITGLFGLVFAIAFLDFATQFRARVFRVKALQAEAPERPSTARFFLTVCGAGLLMVPLACGVAVITRHAVLDSTLDYFARTGLLPERLVLVVFCALLLVALAALILAVGVVWIALRLLVRYRPVRRAPRLLALGSGAAFLLPLVLVYAVTPLQRMAPWPAVVAFLVVALAVAFLGLAQRRRGVELLTLRGVLLSIFLLTFLLYPVFYAGMDAKREIQMVEAAESFDEGRDPRILFAIEQVLEEAAPTEPGIRRALEDTAAVGGHRAQADSLARELLRGSFLASLGFYDVSLTLLDETGTPVGRYYEAEQAVGQAALDQLDAQEFFYYRQMYEERGAAGIMIERVTGRLDPNRLQYIGLRPLTLPERLAPAGWVLARAEPQTLFRYDETPFPRVLLPSGIFGKLQASLSLAYFREGVLRRSLGRDFGRYRLAERVRQELVAQQQLWRVEDVEGRRYLTYYRRQEPEVVSVDAPPLTPLPGASVIAVRAPAFTTFDHLYYLLRLTVAGLFIGIPCYLLGLYFRKRAGLLPAPRVRFRDKVLNAFLAVGIISVAAVGFAGMEVVTEETEGAVRSWLRQHLERVEETLALEAHRDEMPYHVLTRTSLDSLAVRTGLDLILYQGQELVASSRPQLVRDRLIDDRLPIEAYAALYFDGYRFTYTDEQVGSFTYKAGFRALLDEQGQPSYIVSIPALPEQEHIEEERARTVAYLFGALLLLVLVVMLTASLLANALTRPMARLRAGLEAVAKGQFERPIPVSTRDEIGELVQTFNTMQQQLAESRRQLAQQERQLAWREMARQVAHEIKNPLTPMKLSVQHLRRAYEAALADGAHDARTARFSSLFDRITSTLIEQIDTLARIANEFSSFARMPTRVLERLDLNAVVAEAVALMQEESPAEIVLDLHPAPLVVEADREELRRIYINLIKNAIQAIPEEQEGRVEVTTRPLSSTNGEAGWAYSTVADNGAGVPQELQDKIFEPNFSTKTSGTGLGLAIARRSVEGLRGEIGFETEEGTGTTFWIRLPLAQEPG